jgi:hypothetical protein
MLALVGAAATLLDEVAPSTVSAATASAYLSAEFHSLPISMTLLTVLFLVALGVIALAGIRERFCDCCRIHISCMSRFNFTCLKL